MFQSRLCGVTIVVLSLVFLTNFTQAAPPPPGAEYRFKVPGHGDLVMTIPAGWRKEVKSGLRKTMPPTLTITAPHEVVQLLITPLWSTKGDASFNSPEKIHEVAKAAGEQMLSGSKETSLALQDLKGDNAEGLYYTFTDKSPAPGSYECMTSAYVGVGDLLAAATILHHEKDSPAWQQALGLLKGLSEPNAPPPDEKANAPAASAGKSAPKPGDGLLAKSPDGTWEIVIPGNFKKIAEDANASNTSSRLMAADVESGMTLSVYIEPAAQPGDATVARTFYQKRLEQSPMIRRDVRLRTAGQLAIVLYMVPDVKQENMNVYAVRNGQWIDIHLSKVNFTPDDQQAFETFLGGLKIEPAGKPKPR
jgi:hypothetical protein